MRVLLVTDWLYPYCSANSVIVFQIARELHDKFNCTVTIVGFDAPIFWSHENELDFAQIVCLKDLSDYQKMASKTKNVFLQVLYRLKKLSRIRIWIEIHFFKQELYIEYVRTFRKLKLSEFDCAVAFSTPFDSIKALLSPRQQKIPVIAFMLDPWSTLWTKQDNAEYEIEERKMIDEVSALLVTKQLYSDYEHKLQLKKTYLNKMNIFEFPNIERKPAHCEKRAICFNKEYINCVFAGCLYDDIRNPKYLIDLFRQFETENIRLHIFGRIRGAIDCMSHLPSNVIYHGNVSSEEADLYMSSADILINVGNTVLNLLPSKILTYISLGKPILNIIKSPECPTLPYMEKYPLALNVLETPEVKAEDVERVREFLLTSRGKQIPFEEIQKQYYTCTPEYVGKQLYDAICQVVEENRKKDDQ